MGPPDTCYVDSGGASIAYQEFGSGAIELVFVMFDAASHLEVLCEEPRVARIFERLGRFARVVLFDRRGTGLSDPAGDALTLEQQTDDLLAATDAVGFERPAFVGASASSGRLAVFAAATHPERVSALVLIGSSVTGSRHWDPDREVAFEQLIASAWGTGRYAVMYVPSLADDARFLRWLGRFERNALSPGMARRLLHLSMGMDLRDLLGSVRAPTLVLHRRDDTLVPIERGRDLAAGITGARLVDSMIAGDTNAVLDEIEEFLTGTRSAVDGDTVLPRSCSPTSSTRPGAPPSSATATGATCSPPMTASSAAR